MCQKIDENGNKVQQQSESCRLQTPTTFTRSANGSIDHSRHHVEASSIRAQELEYDYDHRRTMTIQSQHRQWPQDIWVHSPYGRQLYQAVLMFEIETETTVQDGKSETNGHASKSCSA
ncbi:hypothetical protein NOF04DRAFT_22429 [Fusarium oxysporum II5]|uniref:Uncharacterized protein n=1 Tax=Fusarium odoratissimum (strain NRRL 54006) TaxID=1089451 RepID=X0IMM5_FUSO5|nr:uncharacterized protein FOIG_16569 [Fusarium odoratissimum NRRL 54006]EXL90168.1 hypothetical protein FOIG_16569 [Fusarium odoratissimum NRRL 54006]KAK2134158.1 hypothetical protein NOF04DRAFT_22429 [Fusarium oxysporum II5]